MTQRHGDSILLSRQSLWVSDRSPSLLSFQVNVIKWLILSKPGILFAFTQNMDNQLTIETSCETPHKLSIRKMYLTKRAGLIRETLEMHKDDITGFLSEVRSNEFNATKDEMLFAHCLNWMQANLHTECNIADLAKTLNVSVRKIQRIFSFFLDKPYTPVLLDMRITAAKNYLAEMKNSIGEVAYLVGVKDHAYFTYLFRKTTGMTPSEYRLTLMQTQMGR